MNTPVEAAEVRAAGTLLLVPNTLDLGCVDAAAPPDLRDVLPLGAIRTAARLRHWVVENAKSARAFLKRVDAIEALAMPLQQLDIIELPRPAKGQPKGRPAAHAKAASQGCAPGEPEAAALAALLAPARAGQDMGLLSEAGLPGVADPGAALVLAAHRAGLRVVPLAGPSSLVLALAASGLNGQSFAFVGYLPQDAAARGARIRELEQVSRRLRQTELLIETPYRNAALLAALLDHLHPATLLSVSCGLTLQQQWTRTDSVERWRRAPPALPGDVPAVFAFLAA